MDTILHIVIYTPYCWFAEDKKIEVVEISVIVVIVGGGCIAVLIAFIKFDVIGKLGKYTPRKIS